MTSSLQPVEIRDLTPSDAGNLSRMLQKARKEYIRHFSPFSFDNETILNILKNKKEDRFFGMFDGETLIGFYMLRGLDIGYSIPAYGVFIDERYRSKGLATLSLKHAIRFCRKMELPALMLKVAPENESAKKVYLRMGFRKTGIDKRTRHEIYHLDIGPETGDIL